ncbi:MAG: hypothetical protein AAEJ52_21045 [Myxococcota bacterium]
MNLTDAIETTDYRTRTADCRDNAGGTDPEDIRHVTEPYRIEITFMDRYFAVLGHSLDQRLRAEFAEPQHGSAARGRAVAPESFEPDGIQGLRALGYLE